MFWAAVVSGAGAAWSHYATDSAYEQFAKFGAFGAEKGASVPADPWAYVDNFSKWSPPQISVSEGLELQLAAARQLYHGFTVEGVDGRPGTIRITPSKLTSRSSFHIKFRAFYFKRYAQDGEDLAKDSFQADGHVRVDVESPFVDPPGPFMNSLGAVEVKTEGQVARVNGALEVTLVPDPHGKTNSFAVREAIDKNRMLIHLECLVRLDVMGDGKMEGAEGSMVVPRAEDGWVVAQIYKFGSPTGEIGPKFPSFGSTIGSHLRKRGAVMSSM